MTYSARIEQLRQGFDLPFVLFLIANWLNGRPSIKESNLGEGGLEAVALRSALEVPELILALNLMNGHGENSITELVDVLWLAGAIVIGQKFQLDEHDIKRRVNGLGKRDWVVDHLHEVAGNLAHTRTLEKDWYHFVRVWLSVFAALPDGDRSANEVFIEVAGKNAANYPAAAFPKLGPFTGEIIDQERVQIGHQHSMACLRLVRDFFIFVLGEESRKAGLEPEDLVPYFKDFILVIYHPDHKQNLFLLSQQKIAALAEKLLSDHADRVPEYLNFAGSAHDFIRITKKKKEQWLAQAA